MSRLETVRELGLRPRGSLLVTGLWLALGLGWGAAMLFAAVAVAGADGMAFVALMPAALLGPAIFGAAAWVEMRQRPRRPGVHVELVPLSSGGVAAVVRRRRRSRTPVRVALVARGADRSLKHADWRQLPDDRRQVLLRFWAPVDLAGEPGERWQVVVIEDEPWGSRHRALDLGLPVPRSRATSPEASPH
ncbi:MAG: hypothetical protein ACR2N6_03425 [Miltoncostaeaceae bacterium]